MRDDNRKLIEDVVNRELKSALEADNEERFKAITRASMVLTKLKDFESLEVTKSKDDGDYSLAWNRLNEEMQQHENDEAARNRELDLRERELKIREDELKSREKEVKVHKLGMILDTALKIGTLGVVSHYASKTISLEETGSVSSMSGRQWLTTATTKLIDIGRRSFGL